MTRVLNSFIVISGRGAVADVTNSTEKDGLTDDSHNSFIHTSHSNNARANKKKKALLTTCTNYEYAKISKLFLRVNGD